VKKKKKYQANALLLDISYFYLFPFYFLLFFLDCRLMYLPLLLVYLAVEEFNLLVVFGNDGGGEFLLHRPDSGFHTGFVQAHYLMMGVGVNFQRLAERGQQMLFVQLRITFYRLVFDVLGDVPEFSHGFLFKFLKSMSHG
jgi:hypothetical protein